MLFLSPLGNEGTREGKACDGEKCSSIPPLGNKGAGGEKNLAREGYSPFPLGA